VAVTRRHYKGQEYTTTLLRRSYREGGKVRNETVGNLSHLEQWMIELPSKIGRGQPWWGGGRVAHS